MCDAENCAKQETNEWITSIEGKGIKKEEEKKKNEQNQEKEANRKFFFSFLFLFNLFHSVG